MNTEQNSISKNRANLNIGLELLVILALAIAVYALSARYDILERIVEFSRKHEELQLDEILIVFIYLVVALTFFGLQQLRKIRISENKLTQKNKELINAISEIKRLRGIIPICASCKKIRDDSGFWHQVEVYVRDHSEAIFSHGVCPDCEKKLYPDFFNKDKGQNQDKSS